MNINEKKDNNIEESFSYFSDLGDESDNDINTDLKKEEKNKIINIMEEKIHFEEYHYYNLEIEYKLNKDKKNIEIKNKKYKEEILIFNIV